MYLPASHDLCHLSRGQTHQTDLQEGEGTHLRQQIYLVHLQVSLQYRLRVREYGVESCELCAGSFYDRM